MGNENDVRGAVEPRRRLPKEIASLLREKILRGELPIGERIAPERVLAPALGTNRNTLREAIRTLEAEGLLHARQGDGVRVRDFRRTAHLGLLPHYFRVAPENEQARVLGDLLRFRAALALEVVELAARRPGEADATLLAGRVEELVSLVDESDPRAAGEAELELYRVITEASGSVAATWVLNGLEPVVRHLLEVSPELWQIAEGYRESWMEIASAIASGDGGRARRELSALMDRGDRRLLALLDVLGEEEGPAARERAEEPRAAEMSSDTGRTTGARGCKKRTRARGETPGTRRKAGERRAASGGAGGKVGSRKIPGP